VDEVPAPERPLLALDHEDRLPGEDEEVLLVGLPVVHRHRLAWRQRDQVDAVLVELGLALEPCVGAATLGRVPWHVLRVDDVPAVAARHLPVLGLLESRLLDHDRELMATVAGWHRRAESSCEGWRRRSPRPRARSTRYAAWTSRCARARRSRCSGRTARASR